MALIEQSVNRKGSMLTKDYIEFCNTTVRQKLVNSVAPRFSLATATELPASPEDPAAISIPSDAQGSYHIPIPIVGTANASFRQRFVFPDSDGKRRRLRSKTESPSASQLSQDLDLMVAEGVAAGALAENAVAAPVPADDAVAAAEALAENAVAAPVPADDAVAAEGTVD